MEAGEIEVWSLDETDTPILGSGLIAEVTGKNRSVRWAVTNPASRAPNQVWAAIIGEDRVVRAVEPLPLGDPHGRLLEFGSLRKAPPGSNTELRLMRELDGSSEQLSRKFGKMICSKVPGLDKRMAGTVPIIAVEYQDRYLKSPLQLKLLFEMLKPIVASKGNKSTQVAIRVRTEVLRSRGYTREPQGIRDDWHSSPDRKLIFQHTLETTGVNVEFEEFADKADLKHHREMRLLSPAYYRDNLKF